ncbi:hypothetical protein LL033_19175 [Clostridium estertheticum]|uniref:hypothetical protein n=1 Tax=Clostridium estertheticum TaxID=238834 RepID=UPI001C0CA7AB|nr:hypothetical protein [Clostridium estertheticum]MBU3214270.1 hypothetical protein [Clostridium estertheticum]WAG54715.1 hypothetical protein LL033_19175 [Clostridium estertheticum]
MKYVLSIDHFNESCSIRSLVNAIKSDDKSQLLELLYMFDSNIVGIEMLPGKGMALLLEDSQEIKLLKLLLKMMVTYANGKLSIHC